MASNTSLIFVPGFCSVGSVVYAALINHLSSKYDLPKSSLIPVDLPSCDAIATKADLKPSGLSVDITAIRSAITTQLDLGQDVLIIAHSYGGTPSLCAADGLWKPHGTASGRPNGVLRIALISSSLSLPGKSVASDRQSWREAHPDVLMSDEGARVEEHGGEHFIIPESIDQVWMSDLTPDHPVRKSLKPSPLSCPMTLVPECDVTKWRVSYLVTTELDHAMPEAFQMWLVERARAAAAEVDVKKMKSGHFVQVSHVEEVAEWVRAMTV